MDETIYKAFAGMYDALMADTPYEQWAAYIHGVFKQRLKNSGKNATILDLACGTGNITLMLAKKGYDMIAVDASADMLSEARRKADEENLDVLFLNQDMINLDLFGTVDGVTCVCDGLNYILTEEGIGRVFERVRLFLNPGGIFIFDMNTEYTFKESFGNQRFQAEAPSGESYVWDNLYHEEKKINEYTMNFFPLGNSEGILEVHYQRAYPPGDIFNMLLAAGFRSVAIYDGYSHKPIHGESGRITFIASI